MSASYINNMLHGRKTITGKAARSWKNCLGWNPAGSITIRRVKMDAHNANKSSSSSIKELE